MKILIGWLSLGSKKPKSPKQASVFAPFSGMNGANKIRVGSSHAPDANVGPGIELE